MEGRLGARPQGAPSAEGGRAHQEAADHLREPRPAHDRRLLRALVLRLRDAHRRPALQERSGREAPLAADGRAHRGEVGAQLGRQPGGNRGARPPRPRHGRPPGARQAQLRAGVHVLPAAHLRALPEPVLRGVVPLRRDVQARGGRDRAGRPGQVPRLALLRVGLPLQEGVLQPPHRQGREVHPLLPAHRGRPAHDLLGDLRGPHPLPRPGALRLGPGRGGRVGARRARPAEGPARRLPRPRGPGDPRPGLPRRHSRRLDRGGAALPGVRDGDPLRRGPAAAPRVPHAADGLVRAAAVAHRQLASRPTATRPTRTTSCRPSTRCASRSSTSPT